MGGDSHQHVRVHVVYNESDLRVNERSPVADAAPFSRGAIHPANALTLHTALSTRRDA